MKRVSKHINQKDPKICNQVLKQILTPSTFTKTKSIINPFSTEDIQV
jgi:hypothetical protein